MAGRNRLENDGATALAEAFGVSGFCMSWEWFPALGQLRPKQIASPPGAYWLILSVYA